MGSAGRWALRAGLERWALGRWALAAGLGRRALGRWAFGAWRNLMSVGSHRERVGQLEGALVRQLGCKVGRHWEPGAI